MSFPCRLAASVLFLLGLYTLPACSESGAGTPNGCETDLDCSRRDRCEDKVCVPIDEGDTVDGDVTASDVGLGDGIAEDVEISVDTIQTSDGEGTDADVVLETDAITADTTDTADVVDLCAGLCDADELCDDGRCFCTPGRSRLCGSKIGECRQGQSVCRNGQWDTCEGDARPTPETCDGRDNNCNGFRDELVCFPPVVACPASDAVPLGEAVLMTGVGSDPDGGDVTYEWTIVTAPDGTARDQVIGADAVLDFEPEVAGTWRVRLCITDDEDVEVCCETEVTAIPPCVIPAVPQLNACGVSWDRRPIVQFKPLPLGERYELTIAGSPWAGVIQAG